MILIAICCLALISCSVNVQGIPLWQIQPGPQARSQVDKDQEKIDRALGPRPKGTGVIILGAVAIFLISTAVTAGGIYAVTESTN